MTTQPDALAELDWAQYTCQCTHGHTCTNRATHVVHIHAIDRCNDPAWGISGNRVEIRCAECVLALMEEVSYKLAQLRKCQARGLIGCLTCGAPVVDLGDVLREVEAL